MASARYVYLDESIVAWEDATIHVHSPAVKYGAGVFEGLRGYWREDTREMLVFRLAEHLARLEFSQRSMRFSEIVPADRVAHGVLEVLRANAFRENVHIRASVLVDGTGDSAARGPVRMSVVAAPRPTPAFAIHGCSAQVSSWVRVPDTSMPMRVKANANYNNARMAAMQAKEDGYDTAILLNSRGKVSEGPGMCLFVVRDGVPITPSITSDILESITRDTVMTLLRERFHRAPVERDLDRSEFVAAEEAFFCGTGWEITPITRIDGYVVGDGTVGPLTRELQALYFDVVSRRVDEYAHWCTPVPETTGAEER